MKHSRGISWKPNSFRVHLPYNDRVFHVASQVVWFYDELIVHDPVVVLLNQPDEDIEKKKTKLRDLLQGLSYFQAAIQEGYILFSSSFSDGRAADSIESTSSLVNVPEIQDALREATYFGYKEGVDSKGGRAGIYQMELDGGSVLGIIFETLVEGAQSPPMVIGERLPLIDPQQLAEIIKQNPYEPLQSVYAEEIRRSILFVERARQIGAAALFDRKVDSVILSYAGRAAELDQGNASIAVLNVALPYLRGVPPERLEDVRRKSPNAFEDFRGKLYEIVSSYERRSGRFRQD